MDLPALTGKICLVTGATSGIGLETAVNLAKAGALVAITARDEAKGRKCVEEIKGRSGAARVDLLLCDFTSQESTRKLASQVLANYPALHILVNNAGTVYAQRELTTEGIEKTFAVNHLGYFLLTNLLLERIVASAPSRIVNVASTGHHQGTMDFDDLNFERGYSTLKAYGRSKLANVLFTSELARRLEGKNVLVNCLHPGVVATNIWSHASFWAQPFLAIAKLFFVTPAQGAETITYLAASPEIEGQSGGYYVQCKPARTSRLARDEAVAKRLWDVSLKLTGLGPPA